MVRFSNLNIWQSHKIDYSASLAVNVNTLTIGQAKTRNSSHERSSLRSIVSGVKLQQAIKKLRNKNKKAPQGAFFYDIVSPLGPIVQW